MAKQRLFGTDGVRGVANDDLTALLALRLGMAMGNWVRQTAPEKPAAPVIPPLRHSGAAGVRHERPFVIVGRDTRLSGDMLENALASGLAAMGVDTLNIGIVPTPAVAQIVLTRGAAAGVVLSASHNPFEDNGIKFFGGNGRKLPDRVEDEIEAMLANLDSLPRPRGGDIGRVLATREPIEEYVSRVMATMRGAGAFPLGGMRLVLDCANGAAFELAPRIFSELGADVTVLHASPNGVNINVDCGSTRPQSMAAKVREIGADAGLAFDGDADRVMLADAQGEIVDGDRMMAIIALSLHDRGKLNGDVVVATIMSNVGLEQALAEKGVRLQRTDVGDRYVAEAMESLGAAVGGEQSGHILLPDLTPTGDGLVTGLQTLMVMRETGKPLAELARVVQTCPQLLKNVRVRSKQGWGEDADIQQAIVTAREKLDNPEWLSVRASGTEPLIRVMAQGTEKDLVETIVHDLCAIIERKLGPS